MSEEIRKLYEDYKYEKNHFKKAEILRELSRDKDINLSEIGKNIGLSASYISHILRLLKLPELIVDGYYSNLVTITHLYIISRLLSEKDMIEVYEKVLTKNMTTLETDEIVRQKLYGVKSEGEYLTEEENKAYIDLLKNGFGSEVKIVQSRVKTKLFLEFKGSLKETTQKLKSLLNRLKNS